MHGANYSVPLVLFLPGIWCGVPVKGFINALAKGTHLYGREGVLPETFPEGTFNLPFRRVREDSHGRRESKAQSHFYPLPLPHTPSKQGGVVRGRGKG